MESLADPSNRSSKNPPPYTIDQDWNQQYTNHPRKNILRYTVSGRKGIPDVVNVARGCYKRRKLYVPKEYPHGRSANFWEMLVPTPKRKWRKSRYQKWVFGFNIVCTGHCLLWLRPCSHQRLHQCHWTRRSHICNFRCWIEAQCWSLFCHRCLAGSC